MVKNIKYENDFIICTYQSASVLWSKYNEKNNELIIQFVKTNQKYYFPNVKRNDYLLFQNAKSQGKAFNTYIKKYSTPNNKNINLQ
jgi:hypothetical protein